jgi:hypothetical protein
MGETGINIGLCIYLDDKFEDEEHWSPVKSQYTGGRATFSSLAIAAGDIPASLRALMRVTSTF